MGHEIGGLYYLNFAPIYPSHALQSLVSILQWHSRLGHRSLSTLKHQISSLYLILLHLIYLIKASSIISRLFTLYNKIVWLNERIIIYWMLCALSYLIYMSPNNFWAMLFSLLIILSSEYAHPLILSCFLLQPRSPYL